MASIEGKTVVFTGLVAGLQKYQVLNLLEGLGGDIRTKVSHQTDVLVVGGTPGLKTQQKAEAFGIPIVKFSDL